MNQTRNCEDWITSYIHFTDYNTEPPRSWRTWTAISVIAAMLQRKAYLQWHDYIFPNMYIVLVGGPGCGKGTAMGPGRTMLTEKGIRMAADATTRESLIKYLKESGDTDVDPLTGNVLIHASLTIFSPELTVFLGYNQQNLMSTLTDWYDCGARWTYRTKNMGMDEVVGVWVNLFGATTPDLIHSALPVDAVGSGLTSRIIFVYEEKPGPDCPLPFITDEGHRLRELLLSDLSQIGMLRGEFKMSEEFLVMYHGWYSTRNEVPFKHDSRFEGYLMRRRVHLLKLCMIVCASRSNDMIITPEDFQRALGLLQEIETKMPLTFLGHGKNPNADLLVKISALCRSNGTRSVKLSELLRNFYRDADRHQLESTISSMATMGLIRVQHQGNDSTIFYL